MIKTLSIVIPVYNEEATIADLLDMVRDCRLDLRKELLIVNDGSKDRSVEIVTRWLEANPATETFTATLIQKENGGKGSAVRKGIAASTGDIVIIQDADLEYDPNDYAACVAPILAGECSVVYGSRTLSKNALRAVCSPLFFFGSLLLTNWINLLFGSTLTDEPTCYKCFDGDLIRSLPFDSDNFDWEPEVTCKLLRLGFEIKEAPIGYHPRSVEEGKKIQFKDGLTGLLTAAKWRVSPMGSIKQAVAGGSGHLQESLRIHRRRKWALMGLLFVALLLRLWVAWPGLEDGSQVVHPDTASYAMPALSLADAGTYGAPGTSIQTTYRPPGYPLVLAIAATVVGEDHLFQAAVAINCLLSVLACFVIYKCGRAVASHSAAMVGAALFAFNPTAIAATAWVLPGVLSVGLCVLALYFFLLFHVAKQTQHMMTAAALLGALVLTDSAAILLVAPFVIVTVIIGRGGFGKRLFRGAVALLCFAIVVLPWSIRNYALDAGLRVATESGERALRHQAQIIALSVNENELRMMDGLRQSADEEFASNPERYTSIGAQVDYLKKAKAETVRAYPMAYLRTFLNVDTVRPDVDGCLGDGGSTLVRFALYAMTILLYLAAITQAIRWCLTRDWKLLLIGLAFACVPLIVLAPVGTGLNQLLALPMLCVAGGMAAAALIWTGFQRGRLKSAVVIPFEELKEITNTENERNIYTHPLGLARAIFWTRLIRAFELVSKNHRTSEKILDFGGGSGVFLKALAGHFDSVELIDLDASDAYRIVERYGLDNVIIRQQDIRSFSRDEPFDVITALDVLEHFEDLDVPIRFMVENLKPGGELIVSLPTENWLYELGRFIVRKTKPEDHFHCSAHVIGQLVDNGFVIKERAWAPFWGGFAVPLFDVVRFEKEARGSDAETNERESVNV